ncbi:hypothetical protein [Nocardia puris]|uniref:hypothetical protein n=1 Tax=Nocardia puris TaxID=208602 RepID=UPI002E213655
MRRAVRWVDAESVRHYQVIVYAAFACAGVQAISLGAPPPTIAAAMGEAVAVAWVAMLIGGPALTLSGLWLDRRRRPIGLWMQIAGDAQVTAAAAAYATAVTQATWADRATFAAWLSAAIAVCALAMVVRDIRRVVTAVRMVRQMEAE